MKDLEKSVKKFLKARRWDTLRPSDLAKSIMIEGAELLELFQWENLPLEEVKGDKEKLEAIKKELADVLIYCLEMAVLLGLDSEKIIRAKLAHSNKKYPAKLLRANAQKGSGSGADTAYWKIKKAYRRKGK
jgi:NTP pyrophosphatase (non-canonical NTP hydrolase)